MVSNEEPITHAFVTAIVKGDSTANRSGAPPPPPRTTPGPATMTPNSDVCPGSNDLGNFPCKLIDSSKCNIACYNHERCTAFVLHGDTCYLKSCTEPVVPVPGSTLGLLPPSPGRGPPPVRGAAREAKKDADALRRAGALGDQGRRRYAGPAQDVLGRTASERL